MEKFCDIQTRNELADFLKIPRSKLTYVLYIKKPESYYVTFEIPKKNGDTREICAPSGDLKSIQNKLTEALCEYQNNIWEDRKIHPNISHAFEKDKSIITNARVHRNKRFVLNLDLENFFNAFHFGRVQGFFEKNRYFKLPHEAAVAIAQIACYKGCLPQGAPSSPIITNLICQILDMRLLKIAKKYKLDYTRYADDLTFSTNNPPFMDKREEFLAEVAALIEKAGFSINNKKTRLQFKDSKQEVTGLIVNKKINVDRTYYKKTKAMAYRLYTQGEFEMDGKSATMKQLEGRFSFIDQLVHYNNKLDGEKHNAYTLNGREKTYQAFLYYKYFFVSDRPLIVTEGKTDILYLKAALKSLHAEYPSLIEKDSDGNYLFKISFFKRSKRWKHFFGIGLDGADAMKCLYRYFTPKKDAPDYLTYFRKLCNCNPRNPVILLFDNEIESPRPLKNFLKDNGINGEDKKRLEHNLHMQLIPESKLFLMINPLVLDKSECEIEDLFPLEVLEHRVDGRAFSREDKYDTQKYYGKEIFSTYIAANYEEINFSGFRKLLDTLSMIVELQDKPSKD